MATFISDYFGLNQEIFDEYGAFNVSIVNDLPLFIDPFLLFHSQKEEYVELHDQIIKYLIFLRDKSNAGANEIGLLRSWYCFPEVKQNWLGFSTSGNSGHGLGIKFARELHSNLHALFSDFGKEKITQGSHLEKVCLISSGVGRDNISDFTTNLIKGFLCNFTENFARTHLNPKDVRNISINNALFNFNTESWERRSYNLPWVNGDYVILTPKDMLTRDENWINKGDLIRSFESIPTAIPDADLRAQISNYFHSVLAKHKDREASATERAEAAVRTMLNFPQTVDYYIKQKEMEGDKATDISVENVLATEYLFVRQLMEIQKTLLAATDFYGVGITTYEEAHTRLKYLKDVIENKGGHQVFYRDG